MGIRNGHENGSPLSLFGFVSFAVDTGFVSTTTGVDVVVALRERIPFRVIDPLPHDMEFHVRIHAAQVRAAVFQNVHNTIVGRNLFEFAKRKRRVRHERRRADPQCYQFVRIFSKQSIMYVGDHGSNQRMDERVVFRIVFVDGTSHNDVWGRRPNGTVTQRTQHVVHRARAVPVG